MPKHGGRGDGAAAEADDGFGSVPPPNPRPGPMDALHCQMVYHPSNIRLFRYSDTVSPRSPFLHTPRTLSVSSDRVCGEYEDLMRRNCLARAGPDRIYASISRWLCGSCNERNICHRSKSSSVCRRIPAPSNAYVSAHTITEDDEDGARSRIQCWDLTRYELSSYAPQFYPQLITFRLEPCP